MAQFMVARASHNEPGGRRGESVRVQMDERGRLRSGRGFFASGGTVAGRETGPSCEIRRWPVAWFSFRVLLIIMVAVSWVTASGKGDGERSRPSVPQFRWRHSGPFGGNARRLAVDPSDPNVFFVGTANGYIYRSTDAGRSWEICRPGLGVWGLTIESLLVDRRTSSRLYVAGWDGYRRGGVFVSEDAGRHWRPLLRGQAVRALAQSPSDPEQLVAGTLDGVYESRDGGRTWHRLSPRDHPGIKNVESIAIDPLNPLTMYVGTWHLPWRTTDGGQTWTLIGGSRRGMANDSDIFHILLDSSPSGKTIYVATCSGIYRSRTGGSRWIKIKSLPRASQRVQVVLRHPVKGNILFAGTTRGLWKTTDGGRRWYLVTDRRLAINDVAIPSQRPHFVMLATDQGIFASSDQGETFVASDEGFSARTIAFLRSDRRRPERIYAGILNSGLKSGLYVSTDGGGYWQEWGEGLDGVDVFSFCQLEKSLQTMYVGTNRGLFRSTDGGKRWERVMVGRRRSAGGGGRQASDSLRILALEVLSGDRAILILTERTLYRLNRVSGRWDPLVSADRGETLTCLLVSRLQRGIIVVGTSRGLKLSFDGGRTWRGVSIGGQAYQVQALGEVKGVTGGLYVGTSLGLFQMRWRGESIAWVRCGNGLPPVSVSTIAVTPNGEVIVGDRRYGGLYQSWGEGDRWVRIDVDLPRPRISSLLLSGGASSGSLLVGLLNGGCFIGQPVRWSVASSR